MSSQPNRAVHAGYDPFLVLPENRFAYCAGQQLLSSDRSGKGRLVHINAASGCGKTHLAQNLLKGMRATNNRLNVKQLSAADLSSFTDNDHTFEPLRSELENCQLLICEDIQTLEGQRATQYFLSTLIDQLLACGCQMLFTSRCSPAKLSGLRRQLLNRFQAGVYASIRLPSLSSRIKLLEHFTLTKQLVLTKEAVGLIADEMPVTPRELLAILEQIQSTAELLRRPLNLNLVRETLKQIVKPSSHSISKITRMVAREFGVGVAALQTHSRARELVLPRHCAMFLCRTLSNQPYSRIARYFGFRSHSSVLHGCQRIKLLLSQKPYLRQRVSRIAADLTGYC